jgi:hypothetical protein
MFAVAEITAKYADPFPPAHLIAGTQNTPHGGLQRCSAPTVSLTGLTRFARGQSSCTGHSALIDSNPCQHVGLRCAHPKRKAGAELRGGTGEVCGWQTRDRETLPSRTENKQSERPANSPRDNGIPRQMFPRKFAKRCRFVSFSVKQHGTGTLQNFCSIRLISRAKRPHRGAQSAPIGWIFRSS